MSGGESDGGEGTGARVIPLPGLVRSPGGQGPTRAGGSDLLELPARPPEPGQLAAAVEAVLFTLADPLPFEQMRAVLDGPDESDLRAALSLVQARYLRAGHGLRLVEVAGGWQLRTHPRFSHWCSRARAVRPFRLSRAALETLAVVAYEQPVTRAEVERIRGVDPGAILRGLVERGLVVSVGHREEPGRPLLYGTSATFLEVFGLRDLSDLPTLRDLREIKEEDPDAALDSSPFDDAGVTTQPVLVERDADPADGFFDVQDPPDDGDMATRDPEG